MNPEWLTVTEACSIYRMGRSTFYREVARGRIPIRKLGTSTRIAKIDLDNWVNSLPRVGGQSND